MWWRIVAWWRGWRYHWGLDVRHTLDDPGAEFWAEEGGRDFYGSMSLDEEREIHLPPGRFRVPYPPPGVTLIGSGPETVVEFLPAPGPDWREQTAADLSPGALALVPDITGHDGGWLCGPGQPQERKRSPGNENRDRDTDSGPGELSPSSAPGPDPGHIHNGSCSDDRCWDGGPGRDLTRLADTGDIAAAHQAHPHPGDGWLDGQLALLYEWVREQYAVALA